MKNNGRFLSKSHIEAYKSGIFKKLLRGINEDPELSFEIRRNDEAMVYYHKDKILTTGFKNEQPYVILLDEKYYKESEKPGADISKIDNLKSLNLIRKYFKSAKWLVYKYKMGAEFAIQQNIALGNQTLDNRYLVVDMEWQFAQSKIPVQERINKTSIDIVIVDTEKNSRGYNDIYLAEVKCGLNATEGTSGVKAHVIKTNKLINKPEACTALIQDVKSILKNKKDLGLITGNEKILSFSPDNKPKMMLIIAYRGDLEKNALEKQISLTKETAEELGMEEPLCIMLNALITL